MIILSILATIAAAALSFFIFYANGMRSSPGEFKGRALLIAAWIGVAVLWLAWGFN